MSEVTFKKRKKKRVKSTRMTPNLSFDVSNDLDNEPLVTFSKKRKKSKKSHHSSGSRNARNDDGHHRAPKVVSNYFSSSSGLYTKESMMKLRENAIDGAPSESVQNFDELNNEVHTLRIASESEIHAARLKRQRIRETLHESQSQQQTTRGPNDYIPLETASVTTIMGKTYLNDDSVESAFIREEDDDDDDDATNDKGNNVDITSFGDPGRSAARVDRDVVEQAMNDADVDDEWVAQQMRKTGVVMPPTFDNASSYASNSLTEGRTRVKETNNSVVNTQASWNKKPPVWLHTSSEASLQRLDDIVKTLETQLNANTKQLENVEGDLESTKKWLDSFGSRESVLGERYVLCQMIRDHICDILDCLSTKSPIIDDAMDEWRDLYETHSRVRYDARLLYARDRKADIFSDGGESSTRMDDGEPQVDAFGRDTAYANTIGRTQRSRINEKRRNRRLLRRQLYVDGNVFRCEDVIGEGWITDSDDDNDDTTDGLSGFDERIANFLRDVDRVFDDVDTEFCSFDSTLVILERWKAEDSSSYEKAFVSMSVPTIVAPFVKLELLHWHPFRGMALQDLSWYERLCNYGERTGDGNEIVVKLVDRVVLPHVMDYLRYDWNPCSLSQCANVKNAVKSVMTHLDDKQRMDMLFSVIVECFKRSLDAVNAVQVTDTDGSQTQWSWCYDLWCRAVKILRVFCEWSDVVSSSVHRDLTSSVMCDSVLPFLEKNLVSVSMNVVHAMISSVVACKFPPPTTDVTTHHTGVYARALSRLRACVEVYCRRCGCGDEKVKSMITWET